MKTLRTGSQINGYDSVLYPINGIEVPAIYTGNMTRMDWQKFRNSYDRIGGSEIGTIMGLNEYVPPIRLFREKIGWIKNEVKYNKYMASGHVDEAGIITRLAHFDEESNDWVDNYANERIVRCVESVPYTFFPENMKWCALNIDGLITDDPSFPGHTGVAECKTIGKQKAAKYIGGVPPQYIFQGIAYMEGLNAKFGRFAFLDTDRDFYSMLMVTSKDYLEMAYLMHEKCSEFYEVVQKAKALIEDAGAFTPSVVGEIFSIEAAHKSLLKIDASLATAKWLNDIQKERKQEVVLTGDLFDYAISEHTTARQLSEQYENQKILIENSIRNKMISLGCTKYVGSGYSISYNGRLTITLKK